MDNTTYNLLAPDVKTAAKTVARSWPGIIEEDDAEQEIWLRILEAGDNTVNKIAAMDRPLRVSSLTDIGHQISSEYRDDYEAFNGNFRYGTQEVKRMLEAGALLPVSNETPSSLTFTLRFDLTEGMNRLRKKNASYADILVNNYVGEPVHDHRKDLTRAIDALTVEMNRVHTSQVLNYTEGLGTRKVISNERAQLITRGDYKG